MASALPPQIHTYRNLREWCASGICGIVSPHHPQLHGYYYYYYYLISRELEEPLPAENSA